MRILTALFFWGVIYSGNCPTFNKAQNISKKPSTYTNSILDSIPTKNDTLLKIYLDSITLLKNRFDSIAAYNKKYKKQIDSVNALNKALRDSIIKLNYRQTALTKKTISKSASFTVAKRLSSNNNSYDTYFVTYPAQSISMKLSGYANSKLKSIDNIIKYLQNNKQNVLFVTNGGMYKPDNSPQGLYIENSKEINPINLDKSGYGNFYIQPNGIFLLTNKYAAVIKTDDYNKYKNQIRYATQSGPLLVYNGTINTNFTKNSTNKNIRSGVGIDNKGRVIFAISNNEVNFYDFATFFLTELNCNNALYLDGTISRMYLPQINRNQRGGDFGVMIFVAD